jgi:glycosyltransferase involved in cell wall biosynthesis
MRDNEGLDAYDVGFQASAPNGEVFLSIVMSTYNEGPTIRRPVRQVPSTSYPCRTELIVVDDGSSDETAEQPDGLSCDRLKACRRDVGIRESSGGLVSIIDSDMVLPHDWLSRAVVVLNDSEVDCVAGVMRSFHADFWGRFVDCCRPGAKTPRVSDSIGAATLPC